MDVAWWRNTLYHLSELTIRISLPQYEHTITPWRDKGSFTLIVNVTVFVSDAFDLFNVVGKQHHRIALNPFLNDTKNDDFDGKRALAVCSLGYIHNAYCECATFL